MNLEKKVLELNGFKEFNPMQKKALKANPFKNNLVVCAPTASGKTMIAELCALNSIINRRKKVVYTCPLKALAWEHYSEFKKKYSKELNVRVTISTGDFDSSSKHLQNFDIIFTTNEKLDSLQRHRANWLSQVGLLIVDEVHELDSDRGATLEVVVSKMLLINSKLQIIALSATVPNAKEVASWLKAKLVKSSFRPIPLKEGVLFNSEIKYKNSAEVVEETQDELFSLVKDSLETKGKQALIFANTRKRAENIARKFASFTEKLLDAKQKKVLEKNALKTLNVLEQPTEQCKLVAQLIIKGVCFHHAGLLSKQRTIVEDLFKNNFLKLIVATPTLSLGVNLPSHSIIIPSLYRYESFGMQRIPVREYKQMAGRAGRPRYDSEGRAVLIARNEIEADDLFENYVLGTLEDVTSKLGIESVLRTHVLSLIASGFVFDLKSIEDFFSKTFYAKQFHDMRGLFEKIQSILLELEEMGFVESDEKNITATVLGKRVSELYLDPCSAFEIIKTLKLRKPFSELTYLFMLSNTSEFAPWLSVSQKKEAELWEFLQEKSSELPVNVELEMFSDLNLLKKFNSALMLKQWISEVPEQSILKEFNLQPGILYAKLQILDWLCYSAVELSKLLGLKQRIVEVSKLRKRLKHGIKEELIFLTELKNIGRIRARKLFNANIKSIADLKKVSITDLSRVLGEKIAFSVKKQLGQSFELSKAKTVLKTVKKKSQTALKEF